MFGIDISNKDDLISRARRQGSCAPQEFKDIVELYYLARFFVSVFEARNHVLPIQVWNEYRNALDHFMRHLTQEETIKQEKSKQLKPMKNHIQRATLDILKIVCHATDKWFVEFMSSEDKQALALVNNGEFLKNSYNVHKAASSLFLEAKTTDSSLGEQARQDRKVVGLYLDAAFEFEKLRSLVDENSDVIAAARSQHASILTQGKSEAQKESFLSNVKANLVSYVITGIIGLFLGFVFS